jgi:predicted dinucleotide-binding enzyme
MVCVTIIGTGDLAHGLAHLFYVNNNNGNGDTAVANDHYVQRSHQLLVTKPGLRPGATVGSTSTFHETAVPLVDMNEGIARADVIVLAVPASALRLFLAEYHDRIKEGNKIVVDATNSPRRGQDVISILTKSSSPPNSTTTMIQSVKAFHDIGAVEALLDKPANKRKIPVQMCSNYPNALAVVRAFAEESLGLDVKVIPYQHYGQVAQVQYRLDESWISAIVIMLLLFAVTETYAIFRSVTTVFLYSMIIDDVI